MIRSDSNKTLPLEDWKKGNPLTAEHLQQSHDALKTLTGGIAVPRQVPLGLAKGEKGAAGEAGSVTWIDFCVVTHSSAYPALANQTAFLKIRKVIGVHGSLPGTQFTGMRYKAEANSLSSINTPQYNSGPGMMAPDFTPYLSGVPISGASVFLSISQVRKMCVIVVAGLFTSGGNEFRDHRFFQWIYPLRPPSL